MASTAVFAQKKPQASPADTAKGKLANGAVIEIDYHSPSVKGRKIFGGLLPYGMIWRTGANEATIFTTSKDIKIGGKTLPAGKYSFYAKLGENEWQVIFNSQTGQWGIKDEKQTTTDDPSKDVLVATVKPMKSKEFNEHMKYIVNKKGFVLVWENTAVPVMIE